MNGQGQNIPLVTDTGSGLYEKAIFKAQSHTHEMMWETSSVLSCELEVFRLLDQNQCFKLIFIYWTEAEERLYYVETKSSNDSQ